MLTFWFYRLNTQRESLKLTFNVYEVLIVEKNYENFIQQKVMKGCNLEHTQV